jgi:anthranilate phosphoribosyltransferase
LSGATQVAELREGSIARYTVTAQQFGFASYTADEVRTGIRATSIEESKHRMMQALDNEPGPARDIVAFNAAGALLAADCASSWPDAVALALETLASGAAKQKLLDYTAASQRLSR